MGCDLKIVSYEPHTCIFQSTHPSGVRPCPCSNQPDAHNFNPRTPVGCDKAIAHADRIPIDISIHAPQWGATPRNACPSPRRSYFNPRTPVGCDMIRALGYSRLTAYFNPRTPVGCDTARHHDRMRPMISIHAPQWGATGGNGRYDYLIPFQSTHPSGVRRRFFVLGGMLLLFQSTHPSGVRLNCNVVNPSRYVFQSTHPSGVRHATPQAPAIAVIFQSTHPSGVRR